MRGSNGLQAVFVVYAYILYFVYFCIYDVISELVEELTYCVASGASN